MATYDWHLGIDGNAAQDSAGISFLPNGLVQGNSISTPMALKRGDTINFVVLDITLLALGELSPGFKYTVTMAEGRAPFVEPFQQLPTCPPSGPMFSPYFNDSFPAWPVATYKAVQAGKFLLTFEVPVAIGGEPRRFRVDPEMVVGEDREPPIGS